MKIDDTDFTHDDMVAMGREVRSERHQALIKDWIALTRKFEQISHERNSLGPSSIEEYDEKLRQQLTAEHKVLVAMVDKLNDYMAMHIAAIGTSVIQFEEEKS